MPSHRGHLKNTKQRKVRVVYDNRWETEIHNLRKFMLAVRVRGNSSYIGASEAVSIELVSPGHWKVNAKVGFLNPANPFHYSGKRRSEAGRGRSPEEAFKNWWEVNMDGRPEGWVMYFDYDSRAAWVDPKKYVFKVFDHVGGKWTWLKPLVFGAQEARV